MRRQVLAYLVCPTCRGDLTLGEVQREEDGQVLSGTLVCAARGCRFPIKDGVPHLMTDVDAVKTETAARFADEWTRWSGLFGYYEQQFLSWIAPVTAADFADKLVFEGGCGKGRHTELAVRFGARDVVSVDLGESAYVAFQNTRHLPNAHIVRADLLHPPVKPIFDLALSVGVIHHVPDPDLGMTALTSVVRDGGRVLAWVYGLENNEWIPRFVDPVRKAVTAKLDPKLLHTLSTLPTAALFAAIRLLYRPGPDGRGPARLPYGQYFASMYDFPFRELHSIVFDQLVTPVAYYLPEQRVRGWFAGSAFRDVQVRWHNQMSWTVTALVVPRPPSVTRTGTAVSVR